MGLLRAVLGLLPGVASAVESTPGVTVRYVLHFRQTFVIRTQPESRDVTV